jgi:ribosomal-protein-alanine N-acetyltransferase
MHAQMKTLFETTQVAFEPLLATRLDEVMQVEQQAYAHPWSRANFLDALHSGYQAQMLVAGDEVIGYFVAMLGVEEVHLLNITVAPSYQGQGYGVLMLDALTLWARSRHAQCLWLEVRVSNTHAMQVYQRYGYVRVGERKNYYPAKHGQREHAVVMSLKL